MAWHRLECVDFSKPNSTVQALICLEDVSSVGPEESRATHLVPDARYPTWKAEKLRVITLKNGQAFLVRPNEAERLIAEIVSSRVVRVCRYVGPGCEGEVRTHSNGSLLCRKHWLENIREESSRR